ncbi:MAG: peroxiredoxin-like protein [Paraglaciecola sp.]|jgi:peroxiredoxin-like protein
MQTLPHQYNVQAKGQPDSNLHVYVKNLADLTVAPPAQFGGPGDQWSPEDLFMASLASCFILSFRAIARASNLSWLSLECDVQGELDKLEGKTQFTKIVTKAKLVISPSQSIEKAERLLIKADQSCLVSNSLKAEPELECEVIVEEQQ